MYHCYLRDFVLPCKCGSTRIVYKDVRCPTCDSIEIVNPKSQMNQKARKLRELSLFVQQALANLDPEETVEALTIEREDAAQACLVDAASRKNSIKRWLAISFLLSKYPWKGRGVPTHASIESLITSSAEILACENEMFRLSKGLAEVAILDNSEKVVSTEYDVLSSIPGDVMMKYKGIFSRKMIEMNLDFKGIKETMIQPQLPIVVGDEIYRELKSAYQPRILPAISPSNTTSFVSISMELVGLLAYLLGNEFVNRKGILKTDFSQLEQLRSVLINDFGTRPVKSYFEQFGIPRVASQKGLGGTVIMSTRKDMVFLPYFSIFLLVYLCLRWEKNPEKGRFLRYIGKTAEDVIFSFVKAYALNTNHPLDKRPLIRVPHPEKRNEEIADVMAYNDQYLVVIESKFREALRLVDLDVQLSKFARNLDYIKNNLSKFGFSDALKISPYFYTPFPAYNEWNGIKLIPSMLLIGIEFWKLFGVRSIELVGRSPLLQDLLQSIKGPTAYPVDISTIDQSFTVDTYRVQDGVVEDYDENEITVLIDNPIGLPTSIVIDVNSAIYVELKEKDIGKGDVIKMALFNLNNAWTQIQLVEFRLVGECISPRNELDTYGLLSILSLNSSEQAVEKLVHQTWGEELGDEVLRILKKWNINLTKFIQHQMNKGQNVLIGVGKMLGLSDLFDILVQCRCGEVMGFRSDSFEIFRTLYPDGRIMCNKCDPTQVERLRKLGQPVVRFDHSALLGYTMDRFEKDKSRTESGSS